MNKYDTIPFILTLLPKGEEPGSMDEIKIALGEVEAIVHYVVNMGWFYAGVGDQALAQLWLQSSGPKKFPHGIPVAQILMINGHAYFMEPGGSSFPNSLWISRHLANERRSYLLIHYGENLRTGHREWHVVEQRSIPDEDFRFILTEVNKRYPQGPPKKEGGEGGDT